MRRLNGDGEDVIWGKQGMNYGVYDYDIYDSTTGARQGS